MKLTTIGTFLLLTTCLTSVFASEKIRFAPLPMENLDAMTRAYLPFMDFLETELKTPFEMVYKKSYQDLISGFSKGEIDLAYLGPLPYVVLKTQYPQAEPLATFLDSDGQSTYTCSLIEFAGNPVNLNNEQLPQATLTQPLSTSGYLAVESLLNKTDKSLEQTEFNYQFIGSHTQVAEQVVLGTFQLGGVKTEIGRRHQHLGIRILKETDPMPGFLMVANSQTLSTQQIADIKALILSIPQKCTQCRPMLIRTAIPSA